MVLNTDHLVMLSVQGRVAPPGMSQDYLADSGGIARLLPPEGGICYNVKVGEPCMGLAGDHTEPGVSTVGPDSEPERVAYSTCACIGNEARIVSGDAKGRTGYVTGKHDRDRIIIYFDDSTLELLTHDDNILIKAWGQGLQIADYPGLFVMNIDPFLLCRMGILERDGKLIVPVAAKIPAHLMGSGMGAGSVFRGDYDIMTQDKASMRELGLDRLCFGDVVLLENCDNTYGRCYHKGAASIGIVIHGDCVRPGHGPGVTTIMSSREPLIEGVLSQNANIAAYHPMTGGSLPDYVK